MERQFCKPHISRSWTRACSRRIVLSGTVMVEALEVQPDSFASINTGQRRLSFIPKAFQPQQNWSTPKDSVRAGNRMEMPRRIVTFFLTSCLKTWLRVALLMPTWCFLPDTPMEGIHLQLAC